MSNATQVNMISRIACQERSIEAEEGDDEAAVSKKACVFDTVVVLKDAEQRTETVPDMVRGTEVDVEDERSVPGMKLSETPPKVWVLPSQPEAAFGENSLLSFGSKVAI